RFRMRLPPALSHIDADFISRHSLQIRQFWRRKLLGEIANLRGHKRNGGGTIGNHRSELIDHSVGTRLPKTEWNGNRSCIPAAEQRDNELDARRKNEESPLTCQLAGR